MEPNAPKPDDVVLVPNPNPAWLVVAVFVPPKANDAARFTQHVQKDNTPN